MNKKVLFVGGVILVLALVVCFVMYDNERVSTQKNPKPVLSSQPATGGQGVPSISIEPADSSSSTKESLEAITKNLDGDQSLDEKAMNDESSAETGSIDESLQSASSSSQAYDDIK